MNFKNNILFATVILLLFALQASCGIKQKSLIIQPDWQSGKDAYIESWANQNYNKRNFGQHNEFQASAWTSAGKNTTVRSLIDFKIKNISKKTKIKSATLYLYAVDNTTNGPGHSVSNSSNAFILQRIISKWDETEVSWNNQPETTAENQISVAKSHSVMQDYMIDVTPIVQDMVSNPKESFGFMMKLVNEKKYRRILFASSDYPDASKHPKLVVVY